MKCGEAATFAPGEGAIIDASLIRALALSLPCATNEEPVKVTPVGIRIVGATIAERIELDNATPPGGGVLCPLEFEGCLLDGGFSGAHAQFSRLSFRHCLFRDPPAEKPVGEDEDTGPDRSKAKKTEIEKKPLASVELSGAGIGCDLDMVGARPDGDERTGEKADDAYFAEDEPSDEEQPQHFWVRLRGARIDGHLDLSRARLRAPPGPSPGLMSDPPVAALNLTQAEVHGDFIFVNGARARGRILARECHVRGDIWMTGAKLNGLGSGALLLQSATVDGIIMLDSRHDRHDRSGTYRWFKARGEINCFGLRLGGGFTLRNAELYASRPQTVEGTRAKAENQEGSVSVCLRLQGATVGGSVEINGRPNRPAKLQGLLDFAHLEVSNRLVLRYLHLGIDTAQDGRSVAIEAPSVEAKELIIKGLHPLDIGKPKPLRLSANFSDAIVGTLKVEDTEFTGPFRAEPLNCSGDMRFVRFLGRELELVGAKIGGSLEISYSRFASVRLDDAKVGKLCTDCVRVDGIFTAAPLHCAGDAELNAGIGVRLDLEGTDIAGSLDISRLRLDPGAEGVSLKDGKIGQAFRLVRQADRPSGSDAEPLMHGTVDLRDLACDTLDDEGDLPWDRGLRFKMDHFVYRQATWVSDPPDEGFGAWMRRRINRTIADHAPMRLIENRGWRATRLQLGDFWEPWQIRRNWIYQQFQLEPNLPSPTRHRIDRSEYSPQPFEQAIRVARNEGREDFAAQFEILKRRIEWSLFSERARRPLLVIGIVAAAVWLALTGGITHGSIVSLAGLAFACLVGTRPFWPAHPFLGGLAHGLILIVGIAGTTMWLGWYEPDDWESARNFIAAVLIVVGLRYISTTSDWLMRNLFGYLRLPINAIVSLIVAFLVGWAGVDLANDRKMLIIDVEPVASLVARDAAQKIYVGTFRGAAGAYNVHCDDEIDEALYALDVLIPLIDLRQEIRCEVGRAIPFDERDKDRGKPFAYAAELALGPVLDSEGFWAAAKALYAIAGWFLVSLAILTFAVANRAHGEPSG